MKLKKIISGGQTGADQGGLGAAVELNFHTGGFAPRGFKTEKGPALWLRDFNLTEIDSPSYAARTAANVIAADGTVIFADMALGVGSRTTEGCCKRSHKPYIVNPDIEGFRWWLQANKIETLNVAGNRESKNPGIAARVKDFLVAALGENNDSTL